jgi:hypothetical protein
MVGELCTQQIDGVTEGTSEIFLDLGYKYLERLARALRFTLWIQSDCGGYLR